MVKNVNKSAGIQPDRLRRLLKNLIDIYSPSGKEEDILDYAEVYLKKHGLSVERQEVDENRYNLIVMPEDRDEIDVCFVGHLDTVTAYDLTDFEFERKGDVISGLGTADMKSGCAAMMEAFTVLAEAGGRMPPVGLALVVGEEEYSDGAKSLVLEYGFPWAIVGEPTSLSPCLGHYGYLEVVLRTQGKRAHSSLPELGHNAVESMLKLLLKVTEYASSSSQGLVYNIRQLSGASTGFVVPDYCESWLDVHLPPDSRIDLLRTELEHLVESAGKSIRGLDADIRFEDTYSGYRISPEGNMVKKLMKTYEGLPMGWEPQDFRSHSDASVLFSAGVNPIVLGPGSLAAAHMPDESVSFNEVVKAAQLYLSFARSLG